MVVCALGVEVINYIASYNRMKFQLIFFFFHISISASECNRLKLQLEDMRQAQEAKDNTMLKIQEQIQRLFEVEYFFMDL